MTILEQLVQILPTLRVEEQRRVLDLATQMRDARNLPDIGLPPEGADNTAWDEWSERVRARSTVVLAEEKRRLQALGIIDEHGNMLTNELPEDMLPSSTTSVET